MGTWPEARGSREAGLGRSGRGHESEGEEGDAAHPRSMRAVAAGESVAGSHNRDYGARPERPRPVDLPATSSGAGSRRSTPARVVGTPGQLVLDARRVVIAGGRDELAELNRQEPARRGRLRRLPQPVAQPTIPDHDLFDTEIDAHDGPDQA